MGKEKLKIANTSKKSKLIQKHLKENNKNETSFINKALISTKFLHKKRKIKTKITLEKNNQEKNKYNPKAKSITKNIKIKNELNEEENDVIDDKIVCTHLLLNSYANTTTEEFLPEKTIEERINSMREKILSIFPDLIK